jgi:mRNA interferase MazF
VLVVQSDRFTSSRIATVILIAVTSNLQLAAAPGNVLLSSRDTGLPRDSVANISQVLTVNKSRLTERIGRIPHKLLQRIEEGLRLVLSL